MKVVYFGRGLGTRSLGFLGSFCVEPEGLWVSSEAINAALDRGELVAIRPASAKEMSRAEQAAVLIDIMGQLRDKIGGILDQVEPSPTSGDIAPMAACGPRAQSSDKLSEQENGKSAA
jgi:hypothetical protein